MSWSILRTLRHLSTSGAALTRPALSAEYTSNTLWNKSCDCRLLGNNGIIRRFINSKTFSGGNLTVGLVKEEEFKRLKQCNGFELFGIEQKFAIDDSKLQRTMRKLQNSLHPDRFVDSSLEEQERSNDLSALVNDFYKILGHPYERGKYLLSLVTNKSRDEIEEELEKLTMDGEFLARMMELRETADDPQTDVIILQKLNSQLESELGQLTRELDKDFKSKNIASILERLGKLKFLANCNRIIADRLGSFSSF